MAVTRYDQRMNYEAAEANAIGTAYLRASLLPTDVAANVRQFPSGYVQQRIDFYNSNGQPRQEAVPIRPRRRTRFGHPWSARPGRNLILCWRWRSQE
jgi:hypothetical protein